MSVIIRAGAILAALIVGYLAIGFVVEHWAWFAAIAILLGGTVLATWFLFRSRGHDPRDKVLTAERSELMQTVDRMPLPYFDALVGRLLVDLDAKRVKKFGHRKNDLGCNFVVTLNSGQRVLVRAKKDDRTMRRNGYRQIQLLGGEVHPRWNCDAGVLVTNFNLHRIRHAARNETVAAQTGVVLIDRERFAEWIDTGRPPAILRPAPAALQTADK